jgi:asparagine synthetase B (glutamine-hydrolysing)
MVGQVPGLAGCFALQSAQAPLAADEIVARVARVQALPGVDYDRRVYHAPRLVAVNTLAGHPKPVGKQPFVSPDGRHVVLLHGEIRNIAELRGGLPEGAILTDDCAVLLELFSAKGPGFIQDLRGAFSLMIFDSQTNTLTLFNDHFGGRPLYFCEEDGLLLFGSEKKYVLTLLNRAPRLDPVGMLQVFAHIHNIGARTFIENLRSLPAYSMVTAGDGQVALRQVGYFGFPEPTTMRFREGVEAWGNLLQRSVQRCLTGKDRVVLQLSGGLDSRAIAAAIARERRPFPALTRKADNPLEVPYARAVAERLGFAHHVSPISSPLATHIPAIVWRTECSVSYIHCRAITFHRLVRQLADYVIGGQFGDISSGGHVARYMLKPADPATFRKRVFNHYALGRESLRVVFTDTFLDRYLPQVEEEFLTSFDRIAEKNNVNAYQVWDQIEQQANFILRPSLGDRHIIQGIYPFLDVDYFDFVRSVPEKWRTDQVMYRSVIHRLGPEIRDIPSANDGLLMRGSVLSNKAERLIKRVLRRVRGRLRAGQGGATERRAPPPFRDDPASVALLRAFLASGDCERSIFSADGIEALLAGQDGTAQHGDGLLRNLATFAIGLPMFVHNPVTACPEAALPPLAQPSL